MEFSTVKTKRLATLAIALCVFLVTSVAVSYFVAKLLLQSDSEWEHDKAHGHVWLHEELQLTAAEIEAIDAFEPDYRSERARQLTDFDEKIANLRELLIGKDGFSPEVNAAIHELHAVHSSLQELSIRHYYDMMSVLPADKQGKLRELAVEALSEPE